LLIDNGRHRCQAAASGDKNTRHHSDPAQHFPRPKPLATTPDYIVISGRKQSQRLFPVCRRISNPAAT
jgi:hypothetical protein